MGPDISVKQGTTVVAEQLDEFGDVVDAPMEGTLKQLNMRTPGPEVVKLFLMLNSAEHEIYLAHKS